MVSSKNRPFLIFIVLFSLFIIIAHLVIFFLQVTNFLENINIATASLTRIVFSLLGIVIKQTQEVIIWDSFSLKIITECTGLFLFIVYLGAVLSYPAAWKKKILGLLGLPLLIILNIIRLMILLAVGRFYPAAFDFIHHYLWQTTFVIIVIALWIGWLELVVKTEK